MRLSNNSMRHSGKWLSALALVLTIAIGARAEQFPTIECDTLSRKHLTMPTAAHGDPALFIVGFTHASSEQTDFWAKEVPKDLVTTYTVAVLQDVPRLVRPMTLSSITNSVRRNKKTFTPDKLDRFLVIYKNEEQLKAAAQFQAPDEAYLLLIGSDGSIQWRFHGPFTHTALKDLRDHRKGMRQ